MQLGRHLDLDALSLYTDVIETEASNDENLFQCAVAQRTYSKLLYKYSSIATAHFAMERVILVWKGG